MALTPSHDSTPRALAGWSRIFRNSAQSLVGLLGLTIVIFLAGIIIQRYVDVPTVRASVEQLGPLAPLTAVALITLRAMLFLPVVPWVAVIGAGALTFGPFHGALYVWLGTCVGAFLAFLVARRWIGHLFLKLHGRFLARFDHALESNGLLASIALRLVSGSNVVINYGSGVTSIAFRDYAVGTFFGLVPKTFARSYVFASALDPELTQTLFTAPSLLYVSGLVTLLGIIKVSGIVMLALIARAEYRAGRESPPLSPERVRPGGP